MVEAPVPDRLTVWVVGLALSMTVSAPVRAPAERGMNITAMLQEAPAATPAPQVLV